MSEVRRSSGRLTLAWSWQRRLAASLGGSSRRLNSKKARAGCHRIGGKPFATYVYQDEEISRPYFAHVVRPAASRSRAIIRRSKARPGRSPHVSPRHLDGVRRHQRLRLLAACRAGQERDFVEASRRRRARLVRSPNIYLDRRSETRRSAHEVCRFDVRVVPEGYLLIWDSTFTVGPASSRSATRKKWASASASRRRLRVEAADDVGIAAGNGDDHRRRGPQERSRDLGQLRRLVRLQRRRSTASASA